MRQLKSGERCDLGTLLPCLGLTNVIVAAGAAPRTSVAGCDVVAAAGEAAPPRATAAIDRTSLIMCLIMVAVFRHAIRRVRAPRVLL